MAAAGGSGGGNRVNAQLVCDALQQLNVCINHGTRKLRERAAKAKNENCSAADAVLSVIIRALSAAHAGETTRVFSQNAGAKCLLPKCGRGHQEPLRCDVRQSMKHVLRLFQLCQSNSDEDRLFQPAVPGSNVAALAVCGWLHREQHDNRMKAQRNTKAEFAAYHYTAKRMILFLDFA
jgi:hypothetical protein